MVLERVFHCPCTFDCPIARGDKAFTIMRAKAVEKASRCFIKGVTSTQRAFNKNELITPRVKSLSLDLVWKSGMRRCPAPLGIGWQRAPESRKALPVGRQRTQSAAMGHIETTPADFAAG
jgi:hypothetical protein